MQETSGTQGTSFVQSNTTYENMTIGGTPRNAPTWKTSDGSSSIDSSESRPKHAKLLEHDVDESPLNKTMPELSQLDHHKNSNKTHQIRSGSDSVDVRLRDTSLNTDHSAKVRKSQSFPSQTPRPTGKHVFFHSSTNPFFSPRSVQDSMQCLLFRHLDMRAEFLLILFITNEVKSVPWCRSIDSF